MDKSLLLPLGYKIDINYYKASKYSKSFPVKELVVLDLETRELTSIDINKFPKNNEFGYRFRNIRDSEQSIYFVDEVYRGVGQRYHAECNDSRVAINTSCLPVYDMDGNLITTCRSDYAVVPIDTRLAVEFTFKPVFSYKLITRHTELVKLFALPNIYPQSSDLLHLFDEVADGLYNENGICLVTQRFKDKSLIIPESTKYIVINTEFIGFEEVVFNKSFEQIYGQSIYDGKVVKKVYISRETNIDQLVQIIEFIRIVNGVVHHGLSHVYSEKDYDKYYTWLKSHEDVANAILGSVDIIIF